MITYFDRTPAEKSIIDNAFNFEYDAIANGSTAPNPYFIQIAAIPDGDKVIAAINEFFELWRVENANN
ncbi:MAG: hypothetical protein MJ230_07210 [bacterium]|nr:hypothetical protein [bacterium]